MNLPRWHYRKDKERGGKCLFVFTSPWPWFYDFIEIIFSPCFWSLAFSLSLYSLSLPPSILLSSISNLSVAYLSGIFTRSLLGFSVGIISSVCSVTFLPSPPLLPLPLLLSLFEFFIIPRSNSWKERKKTPIKTWILSNFSACPPSLPISFIPPSSPSFWIPHRLFLSVYEQRWCLVVIIIFFGFSSPVPLPWCWFQCVLSYKLDLFNSFNKWTANETVDQEVLGRVEEEMAIGDDVNERVVTEEDPLVLRWLRYVVVSHSNLSYQFSLLCVRWGHSVFHQIHY